MKLDTDKFNRLSIGIMEKYKCTPAGAIDILSSLRLNIECGDVIHSSLPLQAALLTAVNTGKRAFLGGVFIIMPANVISLVTWPGMKYLNDIVVGLGGKIVSTIDDNNYTICFGLPGNIDHNRVEVVCNDWQAGILTNAEKCEFTSTGSIPTAGIFAGSLSVGLGFLKMAGINIAAADNSVGISLWRPDLPWLDHAAAGPVISILPKKYWLLGLGHLGQAYLWNIGLLPYKDPNDCSILLQDDDRLVEANWSAGLLSELIDAGTYKTRLCAAWIEARGFKSVITERRFDINTKRTAEEPFVALCGFDSAASRLCLEDAGFDLVVESGLGNNLATFDLLALHTFPGSHKTPREIWSPENDGPTEINQVILDILQPLDDEICGIIPITIASKSISASFVGACSGALVIAELLRALHGGNRYQKLTIQLRDIDGRSPVQHSAKEYSMEMSKNGFIDIVPQSG